MVEQHETEEQFPVPHFEPEFLSMNYEACKNLLINYVRYLQTNQSQES